MSEPTRISVVLAAHNGAAYIAQQVSSLLEALASDDEIVIADDASSDTTLRVLAAIGDARLRVLAFDQRVGYQRNFERAINACRGRYVFFSDQDDVCLPERIALSLSALQQQACVCGDARVVDAGLELRTPSYFALRGARSFGAHQLFLRPTVIGATLACRRDYLLDKLPFPVGVPHDHWLSVLAAADGQLAVVQQPFILYRRHSAVASLTGITGRSRSLATIVVERARLLAALSRHWFGY